MFSSSGQVLLSETVTEPKPTKNTPQAETDHLSHIKIPNCNPRQSVWAQSISDFLLTSHSLFPPLDSLLSLLLWWLLHICPLCMFFILHHRCCGTVYSGIPCRRPYMNHRLPNKRSRLAEKKEPMSLKSKYKQPFSYSLT